MELRDYRKELDTLDDGLLELFCRRMEIAAQIGAYKKEHGLPVLDASREREKLLDIAKKSPEGMDDYTVSLFSLIMELSRSCQNRLTGVDNALTEQIRQAIDSTPQLFPTMANVACQGAEGAFSQLACDRLFKLPNVFFFNNYGAVFSAIEKGLCQYGMVPVENSMAGSVNAVYDLMMQHNFRIVRSVRIKVDYSLLVKPGTKRGEIREVYAHEQAAGQCASFLAALGDVKLIPCESAAAAAKRAAETPHGAAAIAPRACIEAYGLESLADNIQDKGNDYTRFVCITRDLEIYPGADRTSLMLVLPHRAGSLYKLLSRFYALGINLIKLESRPMPDRNFEFMFYFDLDTSIYSPAFLQLMGELDTVCEQFHYLGSYSEVI